MTEQLPGYETIDVRLDEFTAHVTLNRPRVRNAMNYRMVDELTDVFLRLQGNRQIRAILLRGAGGTFCSGGDIKEMRQSPTPALEGASNLDTMLRTCNQSPQVVIAQIEGTALGGGFGLVCCSDIALATTEAVFGLPEVRLGVAPAFISPFVLQRIGLTRARELMLTGRRFNGEEALQYGVVHAVCQPQEMNARINQQLEMVRQCAPGAIAAVKELIFTVLDQPLDDTVAYRANLLNTQRQGEEAQEGMLSFLEKRPAKWVGKGNND